MRSVNDLPKPVREVLYNLRDRIRELNKTYGSLSNWGRPFIYNELEGAVIIWANEVGGIGLNQLAYWLGVDKTSLYRIYKRVEREGRLAIYDKERNIVRSVAMSIQDAVDMVDKKLLEITAKHRIVDPMQSSVIKEYWEKPIRKRAIQKGHSELLSEKDKMRTIRIVKRIMEFIADNYADIPTNPDFWEEDRILQVLNDMVEKGVITKNQKRIFMIRLRQIPKFSTWFKGLMQATKKFRKPKETILTWDGSIYRAYLRLKEHLDERDWILVGLHIATGAREGWTRCRGKDLDECKTSLAGIRWENIVFRGKLRPDSCVVSVYESKTDRWWDADLSWLDKDLCDALKKYRQSKGNIWKTILGVDSVAKLERYYSHLLRKIEAILELPEKSLTPHDMRRTSLSLKAELGIPLEQALLPQMPLGVGWEDLSTAVDYYLRFSGVTLEKLARRIEEVRSELAQAR